MDANTLTSCLNVSFEQVSNNTVRHHLSNVLFVMGAV